MEKLYEYFVIKVSVTDITGQVVYLPTKEATKGKRRLDMVVHSGHLFASQSKSPIGKLVVRDEDEYVVDGEEVKKPTQDFRSFKRDETKNITMTSVTCIDDIAKVLKANKKSKQFKLYCDDVWAMYSELLAHNHQAKMVYLRTKVYGIRIESLKRRNQVDKISITILTHTKDINDVDEERVLIDEKNLFMQKVLKDDMKSHGDENYLRWHKYPSGAIVGNLVLDDFREGDYWEMDIVKAYPYELWMMKWKPVYNEFDKPRTYDGHKIENYTSYLVEFFEQNSTFRDKAVVMWKVLLKEIKLLGLTDFKIHMYFRPSKIIKNHLSEHITTLLENHNLTMAQKKATLMVLTGLLGKTVNEKVETIICLDNEDAIRQRNSLKGGTIRDEKYSDFSEMLYYIVGRTHKVELNSGYVPIFNAMVGMARLHQYYNIRRLRTIATVYQSTTDGIFFKLLPGFDVNDIYKKFPDEIIDEKDKYAVESLGKVVLTKRSGLATWIRNCDKGRLLDWRREGYLPEFSDIKVNVNIQYLPDEYDEVAMFAWLKENLKVHKKLLIHAKYPGCGKTELIKRFCKANSKKMAVVGQFWQIALRLREWAEYIGSFHHAFGMSSQRESTKMKVKTLRESDYDIVLIDEIYVAEMESLSHVKRLDGITIATGDADQLPPVNNDNTNNTSNSKVYMKDILDEMFPNQLMVTEIKRARCKKHKETFTLKQIKSCGKCLLERQEYAGFVDSIRTVEDVQLYIRSKFKIISSLDELKRLGIRRGLAYRNASCKVFNDIVHNHILDARKKKRLTVKDVHEGQRYRRTGGTGTYDNILVYTNHCYEVKQVLQGFVKMYDIARKDDMFNVPVEEMNRFNLNYCRTCHGLQGETIYEPMVIFDSVYRMVTREWLVVAFTRNSNWEDLYVYVGDDFKKLVEEEEKGIEARKELAGLKATDRSKGLTVMNSDYHSVEEYLELIEESMGKKCGHPECQNVIGRGRSCDRMNNSFGHVKGNIRFLCSKACNSSLR